MFTLDRRGPVFILTLTGDSEHRLNSDAISSLRSALSSILSSSPYPRGLALVTAAHGRFFSNGFDLAWATSAPSPDEARLRLGSLVALFMPLVADLLALPMPTVAAVSGHAAAAGFMLALAHDYIHMRSDRGFLYMSELDLGLPFPPYFTALMKAKLGGPRNLRDVMMGAAKIGGVEAKERGIVDFVHDGAEKTLEAAVKMAEQLAARNWDGRLYASMRFGVFKEACVAVGVEDGEGGDEEKIKTAMTAASKL